MKRKKFIFILVSISLFFICGIVALAYYVGHDDGKNATGTLDITSEEVVEVSSFSDLLVKGTVTEASGLANYNDKDKVSQTTSRKILKLANNITLESNIVLTNDIQLDMGGFVLNLNDHTLTIRHGYAGCFVLSNGTVETGENGLGKFVLDIPYSGYQKDADVLYTSDGETTTEESILTVLHLDTKYTAYAALYMVASTLDTDLRTRPAYMTYAEVSSMSLTSNQFTPSTFIHTKKCSYNLNVDESCSYVYQNLALMEHYLSTDILISYSSNKSAILANDGKLVGAYGDVTFTATVTIGKASYSCAFPLHVVDITQDAVQQSVGIALLKSYLSEYYVEEDLIVNTEKKLEGYYYSFPHAIQLPVSALGGNIVYSYSTSDGDGTANTKPIIYKENSSNDQAYIFGPSVKDLHLVITIAEVPTSLNMYSTYVGLQETIAYYIANNCYGGAIIYDKASAGYDLISLDMIEDATNDKSYFGAKEYCETYEVSAIAYSLKLSAATDYVIDEVNNRLVVKDGRTPQDKETAITMSITFSSGTFDIDLYIEYLDSSGTTLNRYITYYSIYNATFPSELEQSVILPFSTNNRAPYTCYDVATYTTSLETDEEGNAYTMITPTYHMPKNLRVALWYDGAEKLVFDYDAESPQSLTSQLDAYLTSNSLTLKALSEKTGDNLAYYKFSIDTQNSIMENQKIVLMYNYKFESSAVSWTRYQNGNGDDAYLSDNNTTYMTILGGLFYSPTGLNESGEYCDYAVKDPIFYAWIYDRFKPDLERYDDESIDPDHIDRIIPASWLGQAMEITNEDEDLKNVKDFSGIKYLYSVTSVDLSNRDLDQNVFVDLSNGDLDQNVLNGISEMKSLEKLNLSSCKLTDISSLSKLAAQGTLKELDISKNSIMYFDAITTITSLEKVYVYYNYATNEAYNAYYGSKGICNYQSYADLMRNGCAVYNDVSGETPIVYADSNNLDDYRRLKEVAYQDKLAKNSDIQPLYAAFILRGTKVTNKSNGDRYTFTDEPENPFGLQTDGKLYWGYQGDTNDAIYNAVVVTTGAAIPANTYYVASADTYVLTTDTTFQDGTTYYMKAKFIDAKVTAGGTVSTTNYAVSKADGVITYSNVYYELSNGAYKVTEDTTFQSGKTYYVPANYMNAEYFYVRLTYTTGSYKMIVKYYVDRY